MCKFISIITKGDKTPLYFDEKIRQELKENNPKNYEWDSHTSIADYFKLNEDKCNKYEYCPFTKKFTTDKINNKEDDSEAVAEWCKTQDWGGLVKQNLFNLYLRGCDLKGITLPTSVGGSLDLSCCDLKGITLPTSVGGSLDLRGCDLKGITLPTSVGGSLYLRGCDLKGIDKSILDKYDVIY